MKFTLLLLGVCWLTVMTGCRKPGDSIGAAEAVIKTATLKSITQKYPDLTASSLKFGDLRIRATPDGKETIFVFYTLPASATSTTAGKQETTITKTIGVSMSLAGQVESVYESTQQETHAIGQ